MHLYVCRAINEEKSKQGEHGGESSNNSGFTTALYGVLYTLAKEKFSDSWKFAVGNVVVDFFLILAIMINLEYPWYTDPSTP